MERATRAQGNSLVRSAKAASTPPARRFKDSSLPTQGSVTLTAAGLELALKREMFAGSEVGQVSVTGLVCDLT